MEHDIMLELKGLDELKNDLLSCAGKFPDETAKGLKSLGNQFVKDVQKQYGRNDNLIKTKNWKREVSTGLVNDRIEVNIMNNHPLHHLVENGHAKWLFGKNTGGWVEGKHYTEKTRQTWQSEDKLSTELSKVRDKIMKEANL